MWLRLRRARGRRGWHRSPGRGRGSGRRGRTAGARCSGAAPGAGERIRTAGLPFTSWRSPAGWRVCALLVAAFAVHLGLLSSGALAALLAARRPRRMSSSRRGRPDRFKLDQCLRLVRVGRRCAMVNCNPDRQPTGLLRPSGGVPWRGRGNSGARGSPLEVAWPAAAGTGISIALYT